MTDQALADTEEVRQLFDAKAASWAAKYAPQGSPGGWRSFPAWPGPRFPPGGACWISAAVQGNWPGIWLPPGCE